MNNKELTVLIRDVADKLDKSDETTASKVVQPLRDAGIIPKCHEGENDKMTNTPEGRLIILEWYSGQILSIIDQKSWFAVNSWINCLDKFAPSV